jgi:hypothetical protein
LVNDRSVAQIHVGQWGVRGKKRWQASAGRFIF